MKLPAIFQSFLLPIAVFGCADVSRKTTIELQPALQGQESRDLSKEWFALLQSPTVGTPNCVQDSLIFGLRPGIKAAGQGSSISDWSTRRLSGRMALADAVVSEVNTTVFPIVEIEKSFAGDATIGAAGFLHQPPASVQPANCAATTGNAGMLYPVSAETTIGTLEEAILPLRVGPSINAVSAAAITTVPNSYADSNALYGLTAAEVSGTNSDSDFDRWAIAVVPSSTDFSLTWRLRYRVQSSLDGEISVDFPNSLQLTSSSGFQINPPSIAWNRILTPGIENTLFVLGCTAADTACANPVRSIQILDRIEGPTCRNTIGIRVTTIVYDTTSGTYSAKAYPSTYSPNAANNNCGVDP